MRHLFYQSLPTSPGVYFFEDRSGNVIYIGKAKNLKKRVSSYFTGRDKLGSKTLSLVLEIAKIKTIKVESEIESLLLEANFIQKYLPKYNVKLADSKAYPLIKITTKDKYPKVLIARRMGDKKSIYFGPYPNVGAMRLVLKIARRIFPYQSVLNHPTKLCLYNHLGLCPCPEVMGDENYKRSLKASQKTEFSSFAYKKNIKHLINFLKGNTKKVIKDLEKEKKEFVKNEEFEKAADNQRKIEAIKLITNSHYKPLDYEENPNLSSDLRGIELGDLQKVLQVHGVGVLFPEKIECFDISIISGKYATGSMVVFTNGEKDSSMYRRFKIRYSGKPSDFAMIEEVLRRRLNHPEWKLPDLFIVDGGKGQVSVATRVLSEKKIKIPLIGLAKREETIVTSSLEEIKLPRDSRVLQLLQRIRDEAHRFAITYHRKLRSRSFLG